MRNVLLNPTPKHVSTILTQPDTGLHCKYPADSPFQQARKLGKQVCTKVGGGFGAEETRPKVVRLRKAKRHYTGTSKCVRQAFAEMSPVWYTKCEWYGAQFVATVEPHEMWKLWLNQVLQAMLIVNESMAVKAAAQRPIFADALRVRAPLNSCVKFQWTAVGSLKISGPLPRAERYANFILHTSVHSMYCRNLSHRRIEGAPRTRSFSLCVGRLSIKIALLTYSAKHEM